APYAVHANEFVSNSQGGIIRVTSTAGSVTTTGRAIQADGGLSKSTGVPTLGGQGGTVLIEAAAGVIGDVTLGTSSVRARGATTGGAPEGGAISARSYHGAVTGADPGELNASGGGTPGTVTLQACTGVAYTGTSTPAASNPGSDCVSSPT